MRVGGLKWLDVMGIGGGRQLHDPAGTATDLTDDAAAVDDLMIGCHEGDVTLSLKLAADLGARPPM